MIRVDYPEDAGIICTFRLIIMDLPSTSHFWKAGTEWLCWRYNCYIHNSSGTVLPTPSAQHCARIPVTSLSTARRCTGRSL